MLFYQSLFESLPLKQSVLSNRFVLSPMVTNSSTADGFVTQDDLNYALRRAEAAPLQITGAAYVDPRGQLFEYGFSVSKDEDVAGLSCLAQVMQSKGAKAILQLTHAGRFASHALNRDRHVYGPSPMKLHSPFFHEVKELTVVDLEEIVEAYGQATRRAIDAGFAGVEISSAQRLLIQTFFSTFSNQRKDQYGCQSLDNRSRLGLEVLKRVQEVIDEYAPKEFILGFRATPEETRGASVGYSIEEFLNFMDQALELAKLDYLAIASWGHDVFRNRVRGAGCYQGRLVNQVVHNALKGRLLIMATGGINSAEKAAEALKHADMVGLSTPFITDPEFVHKIKAGRPEDIQLRIRPQDLSQLAIPYASFKDIVPLMDYGESLPKESRELFRSLEKHYEENQHEN
ncbi:NADH-dependent flavin oxidoreductase [Streptococcus ruminantium]|uniref:NADH-dependent flavin oxidoreductase n=1 Tax=Streptococcus ruminantium TaxID=1917441 RepID=UPI0012DEB356|nr:NADH-dependent flavin oxidoreductase [Streptococcus ruminantium]